MPDPKQTIWQQIPCDETVVQRLSSSLNANPLVCRLLAQRGITSDEEAAFFMNPAISSLHHPFEMKDMELAAGNVWTRLFRTARKSCSTVTTMWMVPVQFP
jgi:hypothetical protein